MAEAKKVRKASDMLKSMAPKSLTSRTTRIEDELEERKAAAPEPKAAPMGGDPTKKMTQSEYDVKLKADKARENEAYAKYKARKALGK